MNAETITLYRPVGPKELALSRNIVGLIEVIAEYRATTD